MIPHVLVIDDNADLTEDIRELFEDTGARVSVFANPDEAEAFVKTDPYDLALVDVRLPTRSGLAMLPRLRQGSPDGEIIVMTGAASVHSAMEAVRHGVHAYLKKPFDPADLLKLADRALSQVSLRRERRLLSRELARSEALHRAVIDTVGSLIIGVDEQHRVQLWNESAAQITGWRASEAHGRDVCELLLPDGSRGPLHELTSEAQAGASGEARVPVRTRDGEERVVHWHVRPLIPDTAGGPMVLLSGTDLTERLELEARAASSEAMAAMGRLTSALAHEIRNPLNAATLQLELMRRSAAKAGHEGVLRRAEIVTAEIKRLSSLLDDFLGLARPKHFSMEGVNVVEIAEHVHALHEPSAREAGLECRLVVRGEVPRIEADEGRLKQALINLLVNAIEATTGRGTGVELEVGASDDAITLRVLDDGPGLPHGRRVLEAFETTKEGGTGLGLPIVTRIAEMHGGTLVIGPRSDGPGTEAVITLPLEGPAKAMRPLP
ncbi:MAG: response regulator [Sandaracinaceae bacterium]|nr:response regulator [Sandaracinaceae bacterium]